MIEASSPAGLRAPGSGAPLLPDGPHALRAPDGRRWPVVDAIPFLRLGREDLAARALERLDAGDRTGALVLLLGDQDDWWTGPPAAPADLARLVAEAGTLTLRDAMGLLGFGRVGDYFAHRWSDPTFLAGLALIEAHGAAAGGAEGTVFELACGIGHYGREVLRRGGAYCGADVVFAKLWLARHWVAGPAARLVCLDAAAPWPIASGPFDRVLCQDAFYFLDPKPEILGRLRGLLTPEGLLAIGHVHNSEVANHSAGRAVTAAEMAGLFPDGLLYDDAELTRALVEARAPVAQPAAALRGVEAFAVAAGPGRPALPRPITGGFAMPPDDAALRPNPLYGEDGALRFPSERYAAEYGGLATYPARRPATTVGGPDRIAAIRCRALVDLPERW